MTRATLFGPPGTGKTTTLARWAKQAATKYGGESIMICSLTRTAATEIKSRDTDVPENNVGTLHAHAYRSIEDDDIKVMGKDHIDEWNESYPAWAIPQRSFSEEDGGQPAGGNALSLYDLLRAQCADPLRYPAGVGAFASAYEEFKGRNKLIDFTDMIQYAIDHVDCPVDYIIMDEAQDCSMLEFKLLSKWAAQCKGAVIAGDDDQAAYEWRGASVDAFLGFAEDQRVLGQSYRLPARVKERADTWIRQIKRRKDKEYQPREGSPGAVVELEYRRPADVIQHALSQKGTSMLLTTCGYMTLPYVGSLKSTAQTFCNPYRVHGDFASTWNPLMSGGRRATTASDSVRAFLSPPWTWSQARSWLRELRDLPRGTKKDLEENKESDSLVPLEYLAGILEEEGLSAALAGDLDWFLSRMKLDKKRREMMGYRIRVAKRFGLEGLTDKPRIIVGTIHSVKGGQADNVYLLPDLSAKGAESWRATAISDPIVRQMYIGMTRAKSNLFLLPPSRNAVLRW